MNAPGGRAPLPGLLEGLIRRVLDAADLDLPGRAEVEAELRAHFEDGLDAGVPAQDLADSFGDAGAAGRRIAAARRASNRNRRNADGRWWMSLRELGQELRHAARRLSRAPGFALIVVLTLALGVGANTAIFSVLDAVLLKPLPYADPGRLVRVYESDGKNPDNNNYMRGRTAYEYRQWDDVFDDFGVLSIYSEKSADLTTVDGTVRVVTVPVSAGFFDALGVPPALGRTFRDEESVSPGWIADENDQAPDIPTVVVLSDHLWRDQWGADPGVVGATVRLDDRSYEIVGVMPAGFEDPFGPRADLWTPADLTIGGPRSRNSWGNYYLSAVARLKPGLTLEATQERVAARYARLIEQYPEGNSDWVPTLKPLHADLVGPTRRAMLLILAGAAGLVLLAACVNLANLLFARGLGRDRDVALRAALGSGRGRIVAGLLVETGILALVGGAAGLALGTLGVKALVTISPEALPSIASPRPDTSVFGFALAATLAALVLSGLTPALRLSSVPPADALRSDSRTTTGGRRARRVRDVLAVVQVAAALVLVTGAGLLGRSFAALADVPLHMDPEGVLTFEVNLPPSRYPDGASREAFHRTFHGRVIALPDVASAGAISWLPMSGRFHSWGVYWDPEHRDPSKDDGWYGSDIRVISGDYFEALDIAVVRGARPADVDMAGEPVVWVNQRMTHDVFGDLDPLGQQIYVGDAFRRVVGLVDDVPHSAEGDVYRKTYLPHAQFSDDRNWALTQTVRIRGADMTSTRREIRSLLSSMDPQLVLYRPRPLTAVVDAARAQTRFATVLMAAFALLALALALVGTYGVLAGAVAGRTREFGIRMALGANRASVRGMVFRYAAKLVVPGVLLGLLAAWIAARWVQALLFQVEPGDPWVYGAGIAVFVAVGLLAGWVPARRAMRVDPARTLAEE